MPRSVVADNTDKQGLSFLVIGGTVVGGPDEPAFVELTNSLLRILTTANDTCVVTVVVEDVINDTLKVAVLAVLDF